MDKINNFPSNDEWEDCDDNENDEDKNINNTA